MRGDIETTRAAWEAFQLDGGTPHGVSDSVLRSWQRSRSCGIDPERAVLRANDVSLESPFTRAAMPVLLDMARQLHGSETCLAIVDRTGTMVWRWVESMELRRALGAAHVEEGVQFTEDALGTCGIGTAIETKDVAMIAGPQHYCRVFHEWACIAAPVFHPVTRRLAGLVNINCRASAANQFLPVAARAMAAAVQRELLSAATARQKQLLDAYLTRRARTMAPLVAVNEKVIISDEVSFDQATLWRRVKDASPLSRCLELGDGVAARAWPVTSGTFADGVVLELAPAGMTVEESVALLPDAQANLSPLEEAERRVILEVLARNEGNKVQAASELRISRRSLYDKLHRYGIRI